MGGFKNIAADAHTEAYAEIAEAIDGLREDLARFYLYNNRTAGTRSRKALLKLYKISKALRKDISATIADRSDGSFQEAA